MNSRAIGDGYEWQACQFLLTQGYEIVATNYTVAKVGEIDILASTERTDRRGKVWQVLVAVEVKAKKQAGYGQALEMVTPTKQRRIIKTMQYFLLNNPKYNQAEVRFDVVAFDIGATQTEPTWVQSAFICE